ncbi:MAG TPA: glycosyltransferase family 2 protein [Phycisphaerales bacterium]|nr:glycosyltransferase family 2 protein [Phycisphaerales bacterium]
MRFIAFFLVRDEADILGETLADYAGWCDEMHVLDTGSTDGTWDLVHDWARRDKRVRPFAREPLSANLSLRGVMFEAVRRTLRPGDWIGKCDADEIFHVPPPAFVREHVRAWEGRLYACHYDFVMTRSLAEAQERGDMPPPAPGTVVERLRTYTTRNQMGMDSRWYKFRPGMRWGIDQPNPFFPGLPAQERIPVRHYRYRSVEQIRRRVALRARMRELDGHGVHWGPHDWRSFLMDDSDPDLRTWNPGEALPPIHDPRHLLPPSRLRRQRALYLSGLAHALDFTKAGWRGGLEEAVRMYGLKPGDPAYPKESERVNERTCEREQMVPQH